MSQCLLRSDTVIYDAATQRPVDELVLTFHLVYRHSSVCQFPARLYLGHSRTPHHWSQRSLTERRSCKHIGNLSGVNGSQADGRHMAPTNRSCKHSITHLSVLQIVEQIYFLYTYIMLCGMRSKTIIFNNRIYLRSVDLLSITTGQYC